MINFNNTQIVAKSLSSRVSPAFLISLFFHLIIFLFLFISFKGSVTNNKLNFMPIGIEIGEFKAGTNKRQIATNKKSFHEKYKIVKDGDLDSQNHKNLANKNSDLQKSKILKYNSYAELIAHELEKRKTRFNLDSAPEDVKVTIVFEVDLDETGKLKSYKVVKNSGIKYFDKIATKILTASNSFPNPPAEIKAMGLKFSIPIIFDSVA